MKYLPFLGIFLLLATWSIITKMGIVSPLILPGPLSVGKAFTSLFVDEVGLWPHLLLSLYRTLTSFAISCVIGIPLGLVIGSNLQIFRTLEFLVDFLRSIPPIALFPLFLLILGIGELSKIGVPVYGCSLIIIVNSVYGVQNAPVLRRTVGKIYEFSRWQVFWKIVFPDSLPQVFVGMRTALSLALVLTVVVEMFIGSESGLGKQIYDYHLLFDTPQMYATIIVTGAIGYLLNQLFIVFERRVVHWVDK